METITKQNMPDLDYNNRFFDDNLRLATKFGPGFISVPKVEVKEVAQLEVSSDETKKVDENCQKQEPSEITNQKATPVPLPKKKHEPSKEDQLLQARRERYLRHDPCQQQSTAEMWTNKTIPEVTEYKDHFKTQTALEKTVAGVPARLIKSSGKSMPKQFERPAEKATGKKMGKLQ